MRYLRFLDNSEEFLFASVVAFAITFVYIKHGINRLLAKDKTMVIDVDDIPGLVKEVRRQLALSQEDLARKLGISFATVNRWENGQTKPSKLAKAQLDQYCTKMIRKKKLKLSLDDE